MFFLVYFCATSTVRIPTNCIENNVVKGTSTHYLYAWKLSYL